MFVPIIPYASPELYREFFFLIAQNSRGQKHNILLLLEVICKNDLDKKESLRQEAAVGSEDENETEEEDQDKNVWFVKAKRNSSTRNKLI